MDSITKYEEATGRPEWGRKLAWLPPHMVDGVVRYIVNGIRGGSFLDAVMSGDFFEACRRADDENAMALFSYAKFLHNAAPQGCFGSRDSVEEWISSGDLIGLTKQSAEEAC